MSAAALSYVGGLSLSALLVEASFSHLDASSLLLVVVPVAAKGIGIIAVLVRAVKGIGAIATSVGSRRRLWRKCTTIPITMTQMISPPTTIAAMIIASEDDFDEVLDV